MLFNQPHMKSLQGPRTFAHLVSNVEGENNKGGGVGTLFHSAKDEGSFGVTTPQKDPPIALLKYFIVPSLPPPMHRHQSKCKGRSRVTFCLFPILFPVAQARQGVLRAITCHRCLHRWGQCFIFQENPFFAGQRVSIFFQ